MRRGPNGRDGIDQVEVPAALGGWRAAHVWAVRC